MRILLVGLFFLVPMISNAQASYQFGALPALNVNKNLGYDWRLNVKAESRQALKEGTFSETTSFDYEYVLTDFSMIGSKKVGINKSIAAGYLIRFRDGAIFHRSIQQFAIVKKFSNYRLAHRFSSDQTFSENEDVEFRFRYRISSEFALSGESVDPREFYFKLNNEYLNSFQNKEYDLEIRLVPLLGFKFLDNNKLEWGLDYRLSSFLHDDSRNRFWIAVNWYVSI